ncbi:ABC transporter permease [Aedoeadaptatus pacaensis]|uniref:ABC transporter permease n=1 Tax=Aedoeadaptatus pacaensis TaxID=1776390 RepID=UPI0008387228|nr:ABC transporter permease [Peptoniphilus pacaensis]
MINTESKKYKGLGLYALLILMLCVHVPVLGVIGFTNSFAEEIYPLFSLLDAYFLFQLIFNPVLLSSLVKKVVEIEEKNNMFQLQEMLGVEPSTLLMRKWSWLSLRLFILQLIEWALILHMAARSDHFHFSQVASARVAVVFCSQWLIASAFVALFLILDTRSKSPYFTLFFSMGGALFGILSMLTSRVLTFINPFAWYSSLLSISFVKGSEGFDRVINPVPWPSLVASLAGLLICLFMIKKHTRIRSDKTI